MSIPIEVQIKIAGLRSSLDVISTQRYVYLEQINVYKDEYGSDDAKVEIKLLERSALICEDKMCSLIERIAHLLDDSARNTAIDLGYSDLARRL